MDRPSASARSHMLIRLPVRQPMSSNKIVLRFYVVSWWIEYLRDRVLARKRSERQMVRYGFALALIALGACNREAPVRTRDDIAADSALAADLALANRDTLAIDSIGVPGSA